MQEQALRESLDNRIKRMIDDDSSSIRMGTVVSEFPDFRVRLDGSIDELILSHNAKHLIIVTEDVFENGNIVALSPVIGKQSYVVLGKIKQDRPAEIINTGFDIILNGGGGPILTGIQSFLEIPFAFRIDGWSIVGNSSGSAVIDVWKDIYINFPPTVANTITGTEKPTLVAQDSNQNLALTDWNTDILPGDWLAINLDSNDTHTLITLSLKGRKL